MFARVLSILGEGGAGWLAASVTLPRLGLDDAGNLGVGAEGRARAARGAPNISSFARACRWLGSRAAGEQPEAGRRLLRLGRGE